jgi:acyl-CoA thioesterase-1
MIRAGDLILFQGDSITDAGRNRQTAQPNDPQALGVGYVNHIAAQLLRDRPADRLRFLNRGISGNRIVDLYARWKVDAVNLKPDVISILIGVNDTWHEFGGQNGVEVDRSASLYRMLLDYTVQRLPGVRLVLCEPFVLPCGVVTPAWVEEMAARRRVVEALAGEFGARRVGFQAAFDAAVQSAPAEYWAADGVHPTPAGHRVMADCWLAAVTG